MTLVGGSGASGAEVDCPALAVPPEAWHQTATPLVGDGRPRATAVTLQPGQPSASIRRLVRLVSVLRVLALFVYRARGRSNSIK